MFGIIGPSSPLVTEIEMDGSISLYSPATCEVLVLNETASDVWRLADGSMSVEEIVGLLAAAYGCSPTEIAEDVEATLRRFEERHLLAVS